MLLLVQTTLMALVWASATLAIPSDHSSSHDVEKRVDSCGSYTSKNGLNFTLYCDQNNPFNDAFFPGLSSIGSKEDCMERCSRYWGEGEGCFGMVYVEERSECWIRNSTTSEASFEAKAGHYSALLTNRDQMKPLSETCPNSDLSINSLSNVEGIQYTTNCGKVISGFDLCSSGYPKPCLDSPFTGFFHTETLEECLRICIDQHPLCRAVSWNPGLEIGFANCWPKSGFPDTLDTPGKEMGVVHSATITQIDATDRNCPSSKTYSAKGNKEFEIFCDQLNTGTNITSVHTQNVTACMDACASTDKGCIGILFDPTLTAGYNNCYLQNTTAIISDQPSITYAVMSNTILPSSSPSSSFSGTGNTFTNFSSSKAWIAGPVIGGTVGLLLIGLAIFWIRRRKARAAEPVEKHGGNEGYGPAPTYSPEAPQQTYYDAPASEVDGRDRQELPAAMKLAHSAEAKGERAELPS